MITIFVVFCIASVLVFVLYIVGFLLSIKLNMCNKNTAFESGFLSIGLVQNSFSIHFFIIMLMFVIFDLEIVMFLGVLISDLNSIYSFLLLIFFILSGFYMEWYYGKLLWAI